MNSQTKNTIVGIVAENENEALTAATEGYCKIFRSWGHEALMIDFRKPESIKLFQELLKKNDIAFGFGLQGIGSRLRAGDNQTNLWQAFKVPFLGIHHDHPCYNYNNHSCESPFVANLYHYESFLETKEKYLPSDQISIARPFGLLADLPKPWVPFSERPIKFLYLKSGVFPAAAKEDALYWQELPKPVQDAVTQQLERARQNPNLQLCDLAADLFSALGYNYLELQPTFWGIVRFMDRTLRNERSNIFVEWLKKQEGALIIGNGWDHIDKKNARAEFKPAVSSYGSFSLYVRSQITCNTSPYCRDMIHERTIFGLAAGTCLITDSNMWWESHGRNCPSIHLYQWNAPLADQMEPLLANAGSLEERAAQSLALSQDLFPKQNLKTLFDLVERVRTKTGTLL
ncbi:MAG: hypothetical protein AB7E52_06650 [Bdellovibrionales bacterium]